MFNKNKGENMNKKIESFKKDITNNIVELMEKNGTGWLKSWSSVGAGFPMNAKTKNHYNGINVVMLMMRSFPSNQFASYKQWQSMGKQVAKGEQGTPIVFYKQIQVDDKDTGEKVNIPLLRFSTVFNESQLKDYQPTPIENTEKPFNNFDNVESFVNYTHAIIKHGGDSAFYTPSMDYINMPPKTAFNDIDGATSEQNYYATLLHELTHWTGHKSRLDRLGKSTRDGYAFEELIAEIGATMLGVYLGVEHKPLDNHAKYLNGWIKALKDDSNAIFKASAQSGKAFDYLIKLNEKNSLDAVA